MKLGRSFYIRIAAIVLVILLGVLMFFIGKQHTILIDNNRAGDIKALDYFEVSVDGSPLLDMAPMLREQFVVTGQKHTITIQWEDEASGQMLAVNVNVRIPLGQDMMLMSVPTFMADMQQPQSVWLTPFESMATPSSSDPADNTVVLDDTASFSSF